MINTYSSLSVLRSCIGRSVQTSDHTVQRFGSYRWDWGSPELWQNKRLILETISVSDWLINPRPRNILSAKNLDVEVIDNTPCRINVCLAINVKILRHDLIWVLIGRVFMFTNAAIFGSCWNVIIIHIIQIVNIVEVHLNRASSSDLQDTAM